MVDVKHINRIVKKIKRKYNINNPLELARKLGFIVIFDDLGEMAGYYKICLKKTYIVLNEALEEIALKLTALHEIGHALLHRSEMTRFLSSNFIPKNSKYELEADIFMLLYIEKEFYIEEIEDMVITKRRFEQLTNIINSYID
ncbi:ImmA/IrrE family metallo-endopeptidase [Fusobacterium varium]